MIALKALLRYLRIVLGDGGLVEDEMWALLAMMTLTVRRLNSVRGNSVRCVTLDKHRCRHRMLIPYHRSLPVRSLMPSLNWVSLMAVSYPMSICSPLPRRLHQ